MENSGGSSVGMDSIVLATTVGQAPRVGVEPSKQQKQQPSFTGRQTQADQRGTQKSPLVVDVLKHEKTKEKAAEDKIGAERKNYIDRWTLRLAFAVAVFTGLLVIVGGFGVWAALRTLSAVEDQASATRESITAFINSERAWLSTDKLAELKLEPPPFSLFGVTVMTFSIHNVGKSMCRIKEVKVSFHTVKKIEDLPAVPKYTGGDSKEYILAPGGRPLNVGSVLQEGRLAEELIKELRAHERFLYFYFFVTYIDGHDTERIFRECYEYYCPRGLVLQGTDVEGFREGGPKSYTEYT